MSRWTTDDVRRVLVNPIYTGVGPYPQIVDDDQWVSSAAGIIAEEGAEPFLRLMLEELRRAMSDTEAGGAS